MKSSQRWENDFKETKKERFKMGKIIGVDLGTTNSCVAVMEGGNPVVIPNSEGSRTTPSVVAFTKGGEVLVGQIAKRQAVTNPKHTISSIKRFMGRRFNEVEKEIKMAPYQVVAGPKGEVRIKVEEKKDEQIAVFDLGGGTFDISILEIGDGVFEVRATNGDTHLGGDDFDKKIMDWIEAEFKKREGIDLSKDPMALQRLN